MADTNESLCTFIIHFAEYLRLISIDFRSPSLFFFFKFTLTGIYTPKNIHLSKTICIFIVSANEFWITISKWNGYPRFFGGS